MHSIAVPGHGGPGRVGVIYLERNDSEVYQAFSSVFQIRIPNPFISISSPFSRSSGALRSSDTRKKAHKLACSPL